MSSVPRFDSLFVRNFETLLLLLQAKRLENLKNTLTRIVYFNITRGTVLAIFRLVLPVIVFVFRFRGCVRCVSHVVLVVDT